jgi:excisionase family DNA binding protein
MATTHDEIMAMNELARYLKISKSTLYNLCAEGKVPGHKVGRHRRFHKDVIDNWLGKRAGNDGKLRTT